METARLRRARRYVAAGDPRLLEVVLVQHLVDEQHVVPAGDDGAGIGGQALAVPEGAHLRHRLALLARAGADRRTEADHHLVAARPQPARSALGPVAARRHRVVGAADVDRHHVDAVVRGDHGGAGAHLADLPVARARPLGEHEQIPAVVDEAVDVVGGAIVEPAAVAAERHGVEEQRDAVGLPAAVVEVVGRRGHGGAAAPLEGDRAQDRRGVEVARVVGHEDDRRCEAVEDLAPDGAAAEIPVRHRPEAVAQQRLARRPGVAAARPGDVELGVVPGHLRRRAGPARCRGGGALSAPRAVSSGTRSLSSGTRSLISWVRALPCSSARLTRPSPMPHVLHVTRSVSRLFHTPLLPHVGTPNSVGPEGHIHDRRGAANGRQSRRGLYGPGRSRDAGHRLPDLRASGRAGRQSGERGAPAAPCGDPQGRLDEHLRLRPAHGPRPHDRPGGADPRARDHRRGDRRSGPGSSSSRKAISAPSRSTSPAGAAGSARRATPASA